MRIDKHTSPPVTESYEYGMFVKHLEGKDSPQAKKMLEKLKSLKTCDDFLYFKTYLLFDIFTEFF